MLLFSVASHFCFSGAAGTAEKFPFFLLIKLDTVAAKSITSDEIDSAFHYAVAWPLPSGAALTWPDVDRLNLSSTPRRYLAPHSKQRRIVKHSHPQIAHSFRHGLSSLVDDPATNLLLTDSVSQISIVAHLF